jgi:S1-C subfamily serine protease
LAAAVAGAGLALGGAALLGGLDGDTTTIREIEAPVSAAQTAVAASSATTFAGKALSIAEIYRRDAPGVVQITATSEVRVPADPFDPFPTPGRERRQALGSGFVIDKAGHIVTNFHVVDGAQNVEVGFSNNQSLKARIVGTDPTTDVALLKVDATSRALTPLPLGDSDTVRVGDPVVAIGNPFGLERSITAGIVSALQRQITSPNFATIDHVIQTDAAINRGNSGGPLLDRSGRVIGVNSQIETGGSVQLGNVGVGFAVPINTVKDVVGQLKQNGRVDRPFIGVGVRALTPQLARTFRLPVQRGLLVENVQSGSGAAKAGIKAGKTDVVVAGESYRLGGDVIVKADGVTVASLPRLRDVLAGKKPGDKLELELVRNGKHQTIEVELGRQPSTPSR